MEQSQSSKFLSSSLLKSGRFPETFTILNLTDECPKISYRHLLKTPKLWNLIRKRNIRRFGVKFSKDEDLKGFEQSPFGQNLTKINQSEESRLLGFREYSYPDGRKIPQILREVANFYPIEIRIGSQKERKWLTERKTVEKLEDADKIKQRKEAVKTKNVKEPSPSEEESEPELVKKLKTEDHQYINVEIHQQLIRSKGDLYKVIHKNPELGEKILMNLDHYDKFEKHMQSRIKRDILQDWQMKIHFNETSMYDIEQSLKDQTLDQIKLRREVFFEKKNDLRRLEEKF